MPRRSLPEPTWLDHQMSRYHRRRSAERIAAFLQLPPSTQALTRRLFRFTPHGTGPYFPLWDLTDSRRRSGHVYINGDGLQVRWSFECPFCGCQIGDMSFGVWYHPHFERESLLHPLATRLAAHVAESGCTPEYGRYAFGIGSGNAAQRRKAARAGARCRLLYYQLAQEVRQAEGVADAI